MLKRAGCVLTICAVQARTIRFADLIRVGMRNSLASTRIRKTMKMSAGTNGVLALVRLPRRVRQHEPAHAAGCLAAGQIFGGGERALHRAAERADAARLRHT